MFIQNTLYVFYKIIKVCSFWPAIIMLRFVNKKCQRGRWYYAAFVLAVTLYLYLGTDIFLETSFEKFQWPLYIDTREEVDMFVAEGRGRYAAVHNWSTKITIDPRKSSCVDPQNPETPALYLRVLVKSKVDHIDNRMVMRDLCPSNIMAHRNAELLFVVGVSRDQLTNRNLVQESNEHHDILQSTDNMCSGFQYRVAYPFRSDWSDKHYVPISEYPYSTYPPFLAGGTIILSRTTATRLCIAARYVHKFKFDDVYLGIVAYKLGLPVEHNALIHLHMPNNDEALVSAIAIHTHENLELMKSLYRRRKSF